MPDREVMVPQFFELHAIKEGLVNAVCNTASEGSCVVILLDLPNRYRVHGTGKRPVNSPRKSAKWLSVPGECRQFPRIIIARQPFGIDFDEHVDDPCEV